MIKLTIEIEAEDMKKLLFGLDEVSLGIRHCKDNLRGYSNGTKFEYKIEDKKD